MRYRLNPNGNLGKQLKRLFQSINEDIALALLRACRDPETGVHEARKSCKEIRALLRLVKPQIGEAEFRRRQTFYKSIAGQLSGNRDAMVREKTWQELVSEKTSLQGDLGGRIGNFLSKQEKLDPVAEKGRDYFVNLALDVMSESNAPKEWGLPKTLADLMPDLKRIYRKARNAEKLAKHSDDIDDFHHFRKRSKDLFYCSRALRPMFGKKLKSMVSGLQEMTELQGRANDQAVLLDYLTEHRQEIDLDDQNWAIVEESIMEKLHLLQARSLKMAKHLLDDSPKAFIKSL